MASEIIVNAGREETRVALLENSLVTISSSTEEGPRRGRQYLQGAGHEGPSGMQASFVDIGLEKSAFLYVAMSSTAPRNTLP